MKYNKNQQIIIHDIIIQVEKKRMKHMYLRVLPPDGTIKITAPRSASDEIIREFALSHIDWINKHRDKMKGSESKELQYESGEIHYLWGKPYQLEAVSSLKTGVVIQEDKIVLYAPSEASKELRESIMNEWYREQLKQAMPAATARGEAIAKKAPNEWRIRNMKTRWGTCNVVDKRIWLNLQLAKKSPECLDYVIIHELVHLYVRNHGADFKAYMDQFYPNWRAIKKKIAQKP